MMALNLTLLRPEASRHLVTNSSRKQKMQVVEELWQHYLRAHFDAMMERGRAEEVENFGEVDALQEVEDDEVVIESEAPEETDDNEVVSEEDRAEIVIENAEDDEVEAEDDVVYVSEGSASNSYIEHRGSSSEESE